MYSQHSRQKQRCRDIANPIVHQGLEITTIIAKMGAAATAKFIGIMWGATTKATWDPSAALISVFRSSIEQDLEDANATRLW